MKEKVYLIITLVDSILYLLMHYKNKNKKTALFQNNDLGPI